MNHVTIRTIFYYLYEKSTRKLPKRIFKDAKEDFRRDLINIYLILIEEILLKYIYHVCGSGDYNNGQKVV